MGVNDSMDQEWVRWFLGVYFAFIGVGFRLAYKDPEFYFGYVQNVAGTATIWFLVSSIASGLTLSVFYDYITSIPDLSTQQLSLIEYYYHNGLQFFIMIVALSVLTFSALFFCSRIAGRKLPQKDN
ncbi:Uncharacterised protein [Yersinia intermedia]|nr:Uncharacterised protein [Yersinia intermedia]